MRALREGGSPERAPSPGEILLEASGRAAGALRLAGTVERRDSVGGVVGDDVVVSPRGGGEEWFE